jgi:hypothetical protein
MTVFSGLTSKPVVTVFSSLATKPVAIVFFWFGLKTGGGFLIGPQNQGGGGFSGLGLKTSSYSLVIYASKSL